MLPAFNHKVFRTYHQKVQYHNDLHGADVMQMCYYMLTSGELEERLKLNNIEILTFVIAAVCHDLGHDGFTNAYHINTVSNRAIAFNDYSVQESFHISKTFQILA